VTDLTWICDHCNLPITEAAAGIAVWDTDDQGRDHSFSIVHKNSCDPAQPKWASLTELVGVDGLAYLLSFLSRGTIELARGRQSAQHVADFDEFVDFVRRLQLPNYDAARRHFADPRVVGDYHDHGEVTPYTQHFLRRIAKEYFDDPAAAA
jgi:hypothetical protein